VWDKISTSLPPVGPEAVEAWRILRGLPSAGHELTEEHNPLEAGLWDSVNFDKGCYVGQEVVARLRTYDKVSRAIVGLELPAAGELPEPGAKLLDGDRAVGELTSAAALPGTERRIGLAYVKKRDLREAMELGVGDGVATVVELPFS
jgi:folate-binding protein YgfZ